MIRQKTVYPTREVPHLWIHETQESARNAQGNVSFDGDTIYSYSQAIARIVHNRRKGKVVLFRDESFSVTTSGHQSNVRNSIPSDVPVFTVPSIGVSSTSYYYKHPNVEDNVVDHKHNLKSYQNRIDSAVLAAKRAHKRSANRVRSAARTAVEGDAYAEFFNLKTRFHIPELPGMAEKVQQQQESNRIEAEQWEARDRIFKRQLEEERERFISEDLPAWRSGEKNHIRFPWEFPVALRIVDDQVQSSQGASIPAEHAKKVVPIVRAIQKGTRPAYVTNGHTIHLGHYALNSITGDGTITVGCHVIPFSEVDYVGQQLGV